MPGRPPAALQPALEMTPTLRSLQALALVLASISDLAAQTGPNPRPAPTWLTNAYDVSKGTIQDIGVPPTRRTFRFDVVLDGKPVTVELEPNDIRTTGFRLVVDDGVSQQVLPTPPSVTFTGSVPGNAQAVVSGAVIDGHLQAIVRLADEASAIWGIESVQAVDPTRPISECLVYRSSDSNRHNVSCGADLSHWHAISAPGIASRKMAEIACDADFEFYQRNGSNTTQTANVITSIMNGVDTIYRRDVDIQYTVTQIIVRTAPTYVNTDMGALLGEFAGFWNANLGSVQRDVAHLFTGKGSFSGVIGIAYVGVVCNLGAAYGVSKAFSNLTTNVGLVSHEVGHNWNAPHCDGANPCYIMCSGLGGCSGNVTLFAPTSITSIVGYKDSVGCLTTPTVRPFIIGITPGTATVMPSSTITLNGLGFTGVTTVNVGSVTAAPQVVSDTQINFVSPIPASVGPQLVTVTNASGTSNVATLIYSATNPPIYRVPLFGFGGGDMPLTIAGDANDVLVVLAAFDPTTVPLLGYNVLVNNLVLFVASANAVGIGPNHYLVPSVPLTGVHLYSQTVFLDETTLGINFISPYQTTNFLR